MSVEQCGSVSGGRNFLCTECQWVWGEFSESCLSGTLLMISNNQTEEQINRTTEKPKKWGVGQFIRYDSTFSVGHYSDSLSEVVFGVNFS